MSAFYVYLSRIWYTKFLSVVGYVFIQVVILLPQYVLLLYNRRKLFTWMSWIGLNVQNFIIARSYKMNWLQHYWQGKLPVVLLHGSTAHQNDHEILAHQKYFYMLHLCVWSSYTHSHSSYSNKTLCECLCKRYSRICRLLYIYIYLFLKYMYSAIS